MYVYDIQKHMFMRLQLKKSSFVRFWMFLIQVFFSRATKYASNKL